MSLNCKIIGNDILSYNFYLSSSFTIKPIQIMACNSSMNYYNDLVGQMTDQQKATAANDSFTFINGMLSTQRNDVLLGLCSSANLYEFDITKLSEINIIADLSNFIQEAQNLDKDEQFEKGLKAFFTLNYLSVTDRDTVFTGFYASANLSGIDLDAVAAPNKGPILAGKAEPVW